MLPRFNQFLGGFRYFFVGKFLNKRFKFPLGRG